MNLDGKLTVSLDFTSLFNNVPLIEKIDNKKINEIKYKRMFGSIQNETRVVDSVLVKKHFPRMLR